MHKLHLLNTQKVMFYLIETLSLVEFSIVPVKDILGIHHIFFLRCAQMKILPIGKNRLEGTAPFSHPKPKKKPRNPYRNRWKPAGF